MESAGAIGGGEGASPPSGEPPAPPSRESLQGLDWFTFFLANAQTGFGPFIAVYLTAQAWTQVDIGLVLTIGGLAALLGQIPGGAIVDAARSERRIAVLAVASVSVSALMIAAWPSFASVTAAQIIHSAGSCILGPAIAAISLGLVGHAAVGERLGRNARFAAIGNGVAAAGMGACGYFLSDRAVFYVTVLLGVPTILAILRIRERDIDPVKAHGGVPHEAPRDPTAVMSAVLTRPLVVFAAAMVLFHLANAAMLPLMGGILTRRSSDWATVLIAACIVVPQIVVALFSPAVGRRAQAWGRRPILLLGFLALAIRGVLFAFVRDPVVLVAVQILDGITAAVMAVMVPLIIADVTRGTGHFNLAQGIVGTGVGIGAALSTTFAGYLSDRFGGSVAFFALAATAAAGLALALIMMPETRPGGDDPDAPETAPPRC
ncbi:MFS transporter [Rhodoplanes roseus]|uniref:MFS transporter n=1 Tax=Rhodoplanes roseus TaxID=29409 RepID=A0A327L7F3_9BRAD|nr:MFS transporter [Rhodoplanes roseus]RAI43638.1 MFS transporter [Rhodoplanes roseus]